MSDDRPPQRSRSKRRMPAVQAPTSTRTTPPRSRTPAPQAAELRETPPRASMRGAEMFEPSVPSQPLPRSEELARLYRRLAAVEQARAAAEARLQRAHDESATADEMVGRMLARVGETEARLASMQKAMAGVAARADAAESRESDLAAQLGKLRSTHGDVEEKRSAAEVKLAATQREALRLQTTLDITKTDLDVARAETEEARAELADAIATVEALTGDLRRTRDAHEAAAATIGELEPMRSELDKAKLSVEMLEGDLARARSELDRTRKHALSGEHRLGNELRGRALEAEQLRGDVDTAQGRVRALEGEVAAIRREADEQRALAKGAAESLVLADAHTRDLVAAVEGLRRTVTTLEQDCATLRAERDAIAAREAEVIREATARKAEAEAEKREADIARGRLTELEIDRELRDGLAAQAAAAHEKDATRLRAQAEDAAARTAEATALAEQFRTEMAAARRERNAMATEAQRARRDLETLRTRAEVARTQFRSAVDGIRRTLGELEHAEAEAARLRAGSASATRAMLDQAIGAEHAIAGVLREIEEAPQEAAPCEPDDGAPAKRPSIVPESGRTSRARS